MLKFTLISISLAIGIPNMIATALSLLRYEHWLIRIFDYPKLQMIIFMLASFIMYCVSNNHFKEGDYIYLSLLSVTIIYQAFKVLPYTSLSKLQVLPAEKTDEENYLSLVHCNVLMTNRDKEKCLHEMTRYDPDVILAVETDAWWDKALAPLEFKYPFNAKMPLDNFYGMHLYSKLRLENTGFKFLVEEGIPSLNPVLTLRSGVRVNCYFIHPRPPAPSEAPSSKPRDAELIIVAKSVKKLKMPAIVAGDLNDVGWSHSSKLFQHISGLLDPRIGRGLFATFNANNKFFRWPLDHIFQSKEFRVVTIKMLNYMGSDHFPIYIKLSYEPATATEQKTLKPDKAQLKEAGKKLENVK